MNEKDKTVVIIGAGPAGLTAAYELIKQGFTPIVLESTQEIGGISRTVNYKGYRMDIGGHRFFSKSDWVMNWWSEILPIRHQSKDEHIEVSYRGSTREISLDGSDPKEDHRELMVRNRLSRIYYLRRFFDYPIRLSLGTLSNLGSFRVIKIGLSYAWAIAFPRRPERSLEDFLINRFGRELYRTFFKDYTEKVWGVPCHEISAEWGAQRIKGLSVLSALRHAIAKPFKRLAIDQKSTQTSLIEHFLYPRLGPGQLWEEVARRIVERGGMIILGAQTTGLKLDGDRVTSVRYLCSGREETLSADYVISTMPVKDLIAGIDPPPPLSVREIAAALPYRDFITVGLLLRKMKRTNDPEHANRSYPPDNWIYVQESDVRLGRIQVFNNWSPHLVPDKDNVWIGLEYFCQENDDLWQRSSDDMASLAIAELEKIGLIDRNDVLDSHVVKVPKTYPAYFGAYQRFDEIRRYVDPICNLFLVGRNGMHRYNNQDHSMLTAKLAAEAIVTGDSGKDAIWSVNIDDEYHEEGKEKN